ncbi:MAG: hypothetical protein JSU75_12135 [Gammaproteobacteria bacterium]|nr:MAG: hypothetical protein JSU75_12135 [Gammaproteobacteria bacterium]
MRITVIKLWCTVLALGLLPGMPALLNADDSLLPVIPEAQHRVSEAQGCVEPVEKMRKDHMEYILHQRDETMYEGIRTRQHSLVECINCHVSDAPDAARYGSTEHFCSSCHKYASVQIDCFQCHADRPVKTSRHNSLAPGTMRLHGKSVVEKDDLLNDKLQATAAGGTVHE